MNKHILKYSPKIILDIVNITIMGNKKIKDKNVKNSSLQYEIAVQKESVNSKCIHCLFQ